MDPTNQGKMQLWILCNWTHQGLWHSQIEDVRGIQDTACLTAAGLVQANVAKARQQGRKGSQSKTTLQRKLRSCNYENKGRPSVLLPGHDMDTWQKKPNKPSHNSPQGPVETQICSTFLPRSKYRRGKKAVKSSSLILTRSVL